MNNDNPASNPAARTFVAMADFVGYLEDLIELAKQGLVAPPQGGHHAVVVPVAGKATCHEFQRLEELVAHLRGLHGQEVQVFAFAGTRMRISKGGDYLFTPWGNRPLFVADPAGEPDDDGFMAAPLHPSPPPEAEIVTFNEEDDDAGQEG